MSNFTALNKEMKMPEIWGVFYAFRLYKLLYKCVSTVQVAIQVNFYNICRRLSDEADTWAYTQRNHGAASYGA